MSVLLSTGNSVWAAMSRREIWTEVFPGMSVSQRWLLCAVHWTVPLQPRVHRRTVRGTFTHSSHSLQWQSVILSPKMRISSMPNICCITACSPFGWRWLFMTLAGCLLFSCRWRDEGMHHVCVLTFTASVLHSHWNVKDLLGFNIKCKMQHNKLLESIGKGFFHKGRLSASSAEGGDKGS